MKLKYTPIQLSKAIDEYLSNESNLRTKEAFCLFAGISKETLQDYGTKPSYQPAIKKLSLAGEVMLQNKLLNDNKPVGSIFMLKANYGYVEQQKLDVTSNGQALGVIMLPAKEPLK